uniref:Uncharacterized protein n=1 Tax=Acinetobacter phage vB_Ab_1137_KEN_06 TaxID=3143021 RepID=A0AAU8KYD2_9VIRU
MLGRSLGRSLINGSISVLINYYRKVLGSFSERLYWFGSLPLCTFITPLCRSIYLSIPSLSLCLLLYIVLSISLITIHIFILISIFLLLSYIVLIYTFLSVFI